VRGLKSQPLSRPHIQFSRNLITVGLGYCAHAHAFWEVLPQQAVEVLVGASLPGMVRRRKITFDRVNLFKRGVIMELRAVVKSDRLDALAMLGQGHQRRLRGLQHRARAQLLHDRKAALALHQGQHAMALVAAHDRVAFPVAQPLAALDFFGPGADVSLASQNASGASASVALAGELGHDSRVQPKVSSLEAVPADSPVDRLVADAQLAHQTQRLGNLLRAPLHPQQGVYPHPVGRRVATAAATSTTPADRINLRLRRPVSAVVTGGVARHLTAERRGTSPHLFGNCAQANAASHSRRNEVSFLLGELVISHVVTPVWPERGSRSIPAPQLLKQVLHFGSESARSNCRFNADADTPHRSGYALWAPVNLALDPNANHLPLL